MMHERAVDWRPYVHTGPEVLSGKPVVKNTPLAVDFILGLFTEGLSEEQVLEITGGCCILN
jgi:uncharacterized protein (DUF433 family)